MDTAVVISTCLATALARSLLVSVLPVPAGPSGAPPRFSFSAPINVLHTTTTTVQNQGECLKSNVYTDMH